MPKLLTRKTEDQVALFTTKALVALPWGRWLYWPMVKSESSSIPARMKGWLPELLLSGAVIAIVGSTAWFNLPVAAWGPALIAALGVMYSRMSSREQVRVAERKLFLDLMQRRVAWLDQLADAVGKRDAEAKLMLERLLRGDPPGEPEQLWRMHDCQRDAQWLFDHPVSELVAQLIAASAAVDDTRLKARQGDRSAALSVSEKGWIVVNLMTAITAAIRPYLYVGDIKAPGA